MANTQNQQNVAKFDQWSRTYDRGRMSHWLTGGQANVLGFLNLQTSDWVLDVGCGTGWAVTRMAENVPDGKACGVDISPGMISRARELSQDFTNVEFQVADAESIPYPDGTFNAIICTNSFHHYSSPVQALREMKRVLRPGGRVLIRDSNRKGCWWVWLWDRFNRAFEKGHVQYHTQEEVFAFLKEAGMEQASLASWEHSHFKNGKIGSACYMILASKAA